MAQIGWIIISWWTFSSGVLSLALQDFLDMVRVFLLFKKKKTILKTKKTTYGFVFQFCGSVQLMTVDIGGPVLCALIYRNVTRSLFYSSLILCLVEIDCWFLETLMFTFVVFLNLWRKSFYASVNL